MSDQRLRRWADIVQMLYNRSRWSDIVQMLYKCFVQSQKAVTAYFISEQLLPYHFDT